MSTIYLASQNKHKVEEIQAILGGKWQIKPCNTLAPDIKWDENGLTFQANAKIKADAILALGAEQVLSDDSGLEVLALGGQPGIHSARYAGESASDEDNNIKLLNAVKEVPDSELAARFVCVLCYRTKDGVEEYFEGVCEGRLIRQKHGLKGFGYDPLFVPAGYEDTFAALGEEVKNRISHRAQALKKLAAYLEKGGR